MTCDLFALRLAAIDPPRLARFWAALLGWALDEARPDDVRVVPPDGAGYLLRFAPTRTAKAGQNRIHLDVTSSSAAGQRDTVARALRLGGSHVDIGQDPGDTHVVLADPEGNELCVIDADNRFLAGCGVVGAINCDGTQEVGYFWSKVLGWPLVWDQDEETAIQSPAGGSKITWSGPPLMPRHGEDRLRLDVVPADDSDQRSEVDRLLSLGASGPDSRDDATGDVVLLDLDGNRFCLLARR